MANCADCQNRIREEIGHSCKLTDNPVSLNSWCEQHKPKPQAGVKPAQRITDNPRSAEAIHD